ncbi:hypothetical protein R3P38DRAFT_3450565 [Favolaschia claudopus]|uniref:Uncharacterized protein n=1 Tax=Favolaschia claudopus TaxID=2862362 RepID=A0AAV9ZLQ5_9AGAR
MFPAAADFSLNEIKAYRTFAFPAALSSPAHEPHFSVEDAPNWITSQGYQLYLEHSSEDLPGDSDPNDIPTGILKAYRNYILPEHYRGHPFFSLENPDAWINSVALNVYLDKSAVDAPISNWRGRSQSISSRAPSRAASLASSAPAQRSRASSLVSFVPSSRPGSPLAFTVSDLSSSRPSSRLSAMDIIDISSDSDSEPQHPPQPSSKLEDVPIIIPPAIPNRVKKGKTKARSGRNEEIMITRQLYVREIVHMTTVPPTFDVPHTPTAILLDLSSSAHLLHRANGNNMTIDAFIRAENQDSWDGSVGHKKGDVNVHGLTDDPKEKYRCRRVDLICNGIQKCEHLDRTLFEGLERYEADEEEMQHLWNHELDRNEMEAASHVGILARFYTYIRTLECKVTCDGVVVLVPLSQGPSKYGKRNFVGCSKWNRSENGKHLYASIDANIDEGDLRFVIDNEGLLPERLVPTTDSTPCVLTVHPRVTLDHCPYSHIIDGKIEIAKMVPRRCHSRLVIFIPVAPVPPALSHKAIIFLEKPHNHPAHPRVKPSTEDKLKLETAIQAVGVNGLTVQKLLNAPNTSAVYGGKRIAEASPAYADTQKVRKAISGQKKIEHPHGMEWDGEICDFIPVIPSQLVLSTGVQYQLNMREAKLAPAERYIHTAMNKNGFKLVVTMHPQIAMLIHRVRYLGIDYTFKRADGELDEWEVGGFVDRYNQRKIPRSRPDARNSSKNFDTIRHVTGEVFKLAPFYPDAKCRVLLLDGEVPQVLGLGTFLADYNDPNISKIWTREPTKLVQYCLKVCSVHFERHNDELPDHIPQSVIKRLKSIMGLKTQAEIDEWHRDVDKLGETEITIKREKDRNSWMYGGINKFKSKIAPEDHDLTPNHSNLIETAHAARNAETGIHLPLLEAILQAQERDNIKVRELAAIDRNAVMPKRWNGAAARERHAAQRRNWAARKTAERNDQLTSYDTLKKELETGAEENRQSLGRQKELEAEIKTLQEELVIDKRRGDFKERINALRKDVDEEKSERREWAVRRQQLNSELDRLRKEELAGVRINGRRPERPSGEEHTRESLPIDNNMNFTHSVDSTADSHDLPEYEPAELPIESSISTIEAFRFGESVDISDRPSTSMFGTGAEAHVFAASEDSSIFTFSPVGFDTDTNVSGNPSTSMFGNDTANLVANSVGLVAANNNYQVDPSANGFYSDENGFSSNFNAFDYDQFDRFMLNTNAFEPAGHIQPDNMWSYSSTPEESLDPEPMQWTRASQELPHLPKPNFDPTPSATPSQQQETNSDSPADLDDYVAPQDIDLELSERNIVTGKRQRTKSMRAGGPDLEERAPKRGAQALP